MKPMLAAAKTPADLNDDVLAARRAYFQALDRRPDPTLSENTRKRLAAREGHLAAQWNFAVRLRDDAFAGEFPIAHEA